MNAVLQLPKEARAWLTAPALVAVFDALAPAGETRVVGGAVRNALLGLPVADIDLATTATPEMVQTYAARAGLETVATGIDHGTVMVLSGGQGFEVTTLRLDVETDGRHAKIAFSDDWRGDAARRDFTMNALYCDREACVFDPLGGAKDLFRRKVRFIGSARARIREDYLRILRYFRFAAQYGDGVMTQEALKACAAFAPKLKELARARIRQEMLKLLVADQAGLVLRTMARAKILRRVLPGARQFARFDRLARLDMLLARQPNATARIAVLYGGRAPAARLNKIMEITNKERRWLERLPGALAMVPEPEDEAVARRACYRLGGEDFKAAVAMRWALSAASITSPGWRHLYTLPDRWRVPVFPLSGADLLARAVAPGPHFKTILDALEDQWMAADFPDDQSWLDAALNKALSKLDPPNGTKGGARSQ